MNKLHQLPSGVWIDLSCIYAVIACKENREFNVQIKDRVVVRYLSKQSATLPAIQNDTIIPFNTYEEACAYRDELAALVNMAQSKPTATIPPQAFDYTLKLEKITVVRDGAPAELTVLVVEP